MPKFRVPMTALYWIEVVHLREQYNPLATILQYMYLREILLKFKYEPLKMCVFVSKLSAAFLGGFRFIELYGDWA